MSVENEEKLRAYQWTGNIRELYSVAERYVLGLWQDDVSELFSVFGQTKQLKRPDKEPKSLKEITAMVESQVIQSLLGQGYSKNAVADMLGISRTSLWHKTSK